VIKSYKKIIELYPNNNVKTEAYFRIAEIYFDKLNKPDSANLFYTQNLKSNDISNFMFESEFRLAESELQKREIESAETRLKKVLKNPRLQEDYRSKMNLLLGKVYFWKGEFGNSAKILSKVTDNLFDDNANDALQILTLVSTLKNDSLSLADYSNAEYLAFINDFEKAPSLFDKLRQGQNPVIKEIAGFKFAQILVAENKYSSALEILTETEEKSSLNMFEPEIEYLRGEIKLFALKDYDGAITAYRNILENHANSLYFDKSRQKIDYINELKKKTI
jgi:predicted negative regulator of RcsB-dependent stress response